MTRLKAAYQVEFAQVTHRALDERCLQRSVFRLIVVAGGFGLSTGSLAPLLALFSIVALNTVRGPALIAAPAFMSVRAGFVIVGNHFCYWFCHEGAQDTPYQMRPSEGIGTMILIALA